MGLERDIERLNTILTMDDVDEDTKSKFEDMLQKLIHVGGMLSQSQRAWADSVLKGEKYEPEIKYENMVSSGKVSGKSTVQLLIKDHPLRPPQRKSVD